MSDKLIFNGIKTKSSVFIHLLYLLIQSPYVSYLLPIEWHTSIRYINHICYDFVHTIIYTQRTCFFTSLTCLKHQIPIKSERPERLNIILQHTKMRFPYMQWRQESDIPDVTELQLARFHTNSYIQSIFAFARKVERTMSRLDTMEINDPRRMNLLEFEYISLDETDTVLMRYTLKAALQACGAVIHAIDTIMTKENGIINGFCAIRPPGHHAEPQKAMGFCFFNNVGVGAYHAIQAHACKRVCIFDFDVHHGNGTEKKLISTSKQHEGQILYISMHQAPLFPYTGLKPTFMPSKTFNIQEDIVLNIPLPRQTTSKEYKDIFLQYVSPAIFQFDPEIILLSSGFDAHEYDPLAQIRLQSIDYYWLTKEITKIAWQVPSCKGRIVSVLEGGYHPRALAESTEHHLRALIHGAIPEHN